MFVGGFYYYFSTCYFGCSFCLVCRTPSDCIVFSNTLLSVMSLFGLVVFMYIMVYLCLFCYCSVLLYHMTYLQILAIKSLTGAYDRHSFGSLDSSDIILRGVLLSFFSIFRVSHWGQCEVQVWGGG